jgi:hypothetical protein
MKEWAELSKVNDTHSLVTTKMLYAEMLHRKGIVPKIQQKLPTIIRDSVSNNLSLKQIPTDWISAIYQVLNDIISSGQKLFKHRISLEPPLCSVCGLLDSTELRVNYCLGSQNIWLFASNLLLLQRLELRCDPSELIPEKLGRNGEFGLWITMAAILFNVRKYKDGQLEDFKQEVRSIRWRKSTCLRNLGI